MWTFVVVCDCQCRSFKLVVLCFLARAFDLRALAVFSIPIFKPLIWNFCACTGFMRSTRAKVEKKNTKRRRGFFALRCDTSWGSQFQSGRPNLWCGNRRFREKLIKIVLFASAVVSDRIQAKPTQLSDIPSSLLWALSELHEVEEMGGKVRENAVFAHFALKSHSKSPQTLLLIANPEQSRMAPPEIGTATSESKILTAQTAHQVSSDASHQFLPNPQRQRERETFLPRREQFISLTIADIASFEQNKWRPLMSCRVR